MALDPDGFVHVADDGVARSYAANHSVIDYAALSNSQIQQMISQLPASYQEHLEHLRQVFEGVDGYDVANKSQLLYASALASGLRNRTHHSASASRRGA